MLSGVSRVDSCPQSEWCMPTLKGEGLPHVIWCVSHIRWHPDTVVLRLRRNRCICPRRAHASDLIAAIKTSDEAAALALLALRPGSAWCRDDDGGGGRGPYPVHLAAERGMEQLVSALAAMPGERLTVLCAS